MEPIKQLLMSNAFITVNKQVVKRLGIESAFMLSTLVEGQELLGDKEGWFYQTIETITDLTGLTRAKQDKIIKQLIDLKIVDKKVEGLPAKRYFKVNYKAVENVVFSETNKFVKKQQTSLRKNNKLDCKKTTTINNITINNVNDKNTLPKGKVTESPLTVNPLAKFRSKPKSKNDKAKIMYNMIYNFSEDENIRTKLKQYFQIRVKRKLEPTQWQIILNDLATFSNNSNTIIIDKIDNAIAGGYNTIIASWEKDKKHNKPNFDNTANHQTNRFNSSSSDPRSQNAVDDDGNVLKF